MPVTSGTRTLKDATNEAIRDWVTRVEDTHYIIGSVVGPHPYPTMVRDFQAVIGTRGERAAAGGRRASCPTAVVACVGGGSNAMGIFHAFVAEADVRLIGVEAGGRGLATGRHAAALSAGTVGRAARSEKATCCTTRTAKFCRPTACRRGWTIRASDPSTAT